MACCPTCGQELRDHGIRFDEAAGIVVSGTRFASLPRREADILAFLWQRPGKFVSRDTIFINVYAGGDEPEFNNVVESHISKLRRKVLSLGIDIRSERFKGYQLVIGVKS